MPDSQNLEINQKMLTWLQEKLTKIDTADTPVIYRLAKLTDLANSFKQSLNPVQSDPKSILPQIIPQKSIIPKQTQSSKIKKEPKKKPMETSLDLKTKFTDSSLNLNPDILTKLPQKTIIQSNSQISKKSIQNQSELENLPKIKISSNQKANLAIKSLSGNEKLTSKATDLLLAKENISSSTVISFAHLPASKVSKVAKIEKNDPTEKAKKLESRPKSENSISKNVVIKTEQIGQVTDNLAKSLVEAKDLWQKLQKLKVFSSEPSTKISVNLKESIQTKDPHALLPANLSKAKPLIKKPSSSQDNKIIVSTHSAKVLGL